MKKKIVSARKIAEHKTLSLRARDYVDDVDSQQREELSREAFARGGMRAFNESRGFESYSPEPCGHHCNDDCPVCGEEW